jgi:hypothetical protein
MSPTYNSPGVYRQEVFLKPPPVLQTGVPGFVGFAGPPAAGGLGHAIGIPDPDATPAAAVDTTAGALTPGTYYLTITYYGEAGESIASPEAEVVLTSPGSLVVSAPDVQPPLASGYNVYVGTSSGAKAFQGAVVGRPGSWGSFILSRPPGGGAANRPVLLNHKEDFAAYFSSLAGSFLATSVNGFFDNGGVRCYVVAADSAADPAEALRTAIGALSGVDDLDLVAAPDAQTLRTFENLLDKDAIGRVQSQLLLHCAQEGNRFAILDSWPGASVDDVMVQCGRLVLGQQPPISGALYYPWLVTSADGSAAPPSGYVAGIYARSDGRSGVSKAPANEEIFGVLDLETQVDNSIQDRLNPARVNCLRAFPGRGIRVWGARTLGTPLRPADPWLYVNVRRMFLTLRRWIDLNLPWATFEPNDARLWVRIQRELTVYLTKLFRAGALQGASPAEAFYVKCDGENNPPELRDTGEVVVEIGLAPLAPSEFIVVRIVRRAGATSDN